MHYTEVEQHVRDLSERTSDEARRRFAVDVLGQTAASPGLAPAVAAELTADAATALAALLADVQTLDLAAVEVLLGRIDAGVLTDGDMDTHLLWVLSACDWWAAILRGDGADATANLAILTLEVIDFEIDGAELDDFLAHPRMAAQLEHIRQALPPAAPTEPVR